MKPPQAWGGFLMAYIVMIALCEPSGDLRIAVLLEGVMPPMSNGDAHGFNNSGMSLACRSVCYDAIMLID